MQTVLVIEDEAPIRNNLSRLLSAEGYDVIAAADGAGGIAAARDRRPDLIVCDIRMPQVDGYKVLAALRDDPGTAAIPLIFLTASADRDERQRGLESGAHDYLTKPFRVQDLLEVVRKHLGGGTPEAG